MPVYLARFLAWWVDDRVFTDASTPIHPDTSSMAFEMAWGKQYSFSFLYPVLAYRTLGPWAYPVTKDGVPSPRWWCNENYGPWGLVLGWLRMHFLWDHRKYTSWTHFNLSFMSYMATFSVEECNDPSRLSWFIEHVIFWPYRFQQIRLRWLSFVILPYPVKICLLGGSSP